LFVGLMEERTGSLYLGLMIVAPLAITLFIAGILLPETGAKGRAPITVSSSQLISRPGRYNE